MYDHFNPILPWLRAGSWNAALSHGLSAPTDLSSLETPRCVPFLGDFEVTQRRQKLSMVTVNQRAGPGDGGEKKINFFFKIPPAPWRADVFF